MATATLDKTTSTQLKADFVPLTVLKLHDCQLEQIEQELKTAIESAPNYFADAPIVIDTSLINEQLKPFLDIKAVCALLTSLDIQPIAIRGLPAKQKSAAKELGLAWLGGRAPAAKAAEKTETETTERKATTAATPAAKVSTARQTKIITKPIRSGSQIYAANCDLIVLAAVNAGAEVIADGNIHIHGPLRGRALAGAKGDTQARIFCQKLEAELIAIAGHYMVSEQIHSPQNVKSMVQISLQSDKLTINVT